MMTLLAFALALIGFAALSLSMSRHYKQVCRREPSRQLQSLLRASGWVLLLAAFGLCAAHAGWSGGLVWWVGLLSVAALLVTLGLTYRASR